MTLINHLYLYFQSVIDSSEATKEDNTSFRNNTLSLKPSTSRPGGSAFLNRLQTYMKQERKDVEQRLRGKLEDTNNNSSPPDNDHQPS
jgi:hypothetical protein